MRTESLAFQSVFSSNTSHPLLIAQSAKCDVRVFAGDFVQGSVFDTIFGTKIAIDTINAIGYDVAVLGNHEFNKGPEPVYETVLNTPNTSWISSNVFFNDSPEGFKTFRKVNAFDICWIGALTKATEEISSPGDTVLITEPLQALNNSLAACAQTDNVIAVNHLGYEQDIELCKAIPELDLVIGGHSHTDLAQGLYPTKVEREDGSVCWVITAFAFGRYLGIVDISFEEDVLQFGGDSYLPMDGRLPLDREVAKLIESYSVRLDESIQQVVGVTTAPIDGDRESCRTRECAMGNLVCDAMLDFAGLKQGAVACITNGGGLRASIDAGDVAIEEILTVLPFGNVHTLVTLPGSTIKEALENGFLAVSDPEITGRYPQVSGMTVDVDYTAAAGDRVKRIVIGGEDLVMDEIYKIVTNSFLASGGDGYEWNGALEFEFSGRSLDVLTGEFLVANSPYTPFTEGRINILQ